MTISNTTTESCPVEESPGLTDLRQRLRALEALRDLPDAELFAALGLDENGEEQPSEDACE